VVFGRGDLEEIARRRGLDVNRVFVARTWYTGATGDDP
jgi:hypothetical protein